MILADAIETWGQTYRDRLSQSQLEKLGTVWSTIKRADVGGRPVATMTKEDAGQVMGLFPEPERAEIADLLNTVRKWTLTHAAQPEPAPAQPERWPQPDPVVPPAANPFTPVTPAVDATQAMPATAAMAQVPQMPATAVPAPDPAWGTAPAQPTYASAPAATVQGPPPSTFEPPKSGPSVGILLGGVLVAALVAVAGYFLFIRDNGTDVPIPAVTSDNSGVTTGTGDTTGSGQATVGTDAGTTGTGQATVGTGTGTTDEDRVTADREQESGTTSSDTTTSGSDAPADPATTDPATVDPASTTDTSTAEATTAPAATADPNTGGAASTADGAGSGTATVGLGDAEGTADDRESVDRDDSGG